MGAGPLREGRDAVRPSGGTTRFANVRNVIRAAILTGSRGVMWLEDGRMEIRPPKYERTAYIPLGAIADALRTESEN